MTVSNCFLILSEPMFHQRGGDGEKNNPASAYGTDAANRPGAIEVQSFEFAVNQIGSEQGGRPRSVEAIERSDLVITRVVDSRSPKLFRYCCEGSYLGIAELQIFGPTSKPYLVYRMSYVHISSYSASGGTEVPTETIGLKFGEMGVLFNNQGIGEAAQGNDKSGSVFASWSWVMEIPVTIMDPVTRIREAAGGFDGAEMYQGWPGTK